MRRGGAEATRGALEADAIVIYTLGADGPVALEAVGTGLPDACDGVAAQAIATARSVVDADGRFLASAPGELACGLAVPLPGGGERGAISSLYRAKRPLGERDAEDLAAFAQIAALAIDRSTLERELDRREVLRAGFVEITDALAGTREPAETYSAVASAARRALRASAAVVVTESDGLRASGAAPTTPALVDDAGQAGALLQLAAREGRIVLCTDASSDRRVSGAERRRLLEAGQRSALCVPVVSPAGLAAVLGVVWPEAHAASDDDLDLARHLGTAAAAAIERAETLASERRARARAQELQRIGGLMASNLDAAAVLREIVSQAALLLNADSCALRLVEGDRLVVRAVQGEAAELLAGEQAPITGGPTGEVLARRTPVAVADMAADDRFLPDDPLVQARFAAYLGAPILSPDGDLRGVLALYDRRRRVWKPDELEALEAFANSATVALQNALLYQRVAQEKEKSEAIIASIADGIVVVDADSRIEMWNRATSTMTGVSSRVALRRTLRELLRGELGDHDDAALSALQEAAETGAGVEVRLARGEREIWLQARAAELRDPVEDRIGTVYALRDVSEDRQLDQLKSDFVATVSHELRTPLTSIYGFAETLLRGDVNFADEDRRTFLGYIASESERLTRLVDGLLSVTRLEAGGVELALEDIDVGDVLREIVVRQAERAKDSHRVELHLPAGPLVAAADRDKLRQVVLNLVDNAIKYSPDGGAIDVTATRQLDMVEIRVQDHGIGISAADQRNLFRKFFRADARMTRGIRGIGLGLYLTRGFVTAMGGRIRVESEAGKGSTFIVDLPLRRGTGGGVRAA
jgi:two-component system phosphate regulon sensor histidine kinase PhoR